MLLRYLDELVTPWLLVVIQDLRMSSEEYGYKFNNLRGMAVIIVNETFQGMDMRQGARNDLKMATKVFGSLGFEVKAYLDQTASQMLERIKTAVTEKDIMNLDCFVCVISSHGDPIQQTINEKSTWTDWLWGIDQPIEVGTLLKPTTIAECPQLANKPKLFFIQACRGGRASYVVNVDEGKEYPPVVSPDWTVEAVVQNIPIQKDFLIAWAVQPGFLAFHRPSGSWFIKGLCKILGQYAEKCEELLKKHQKEKISKPLARYMHENLEIYDIVTLMTMVNGYVGKGKRFISNMPNDDYLDYKKAMPWVAHQLIQEVHLYKLLIPKYKLSSS